MKPLLPFALGASLFVVAGCKQKNPGNDLPRPPCGYKMRTHEGLTHGPFDLSDSEGMEALKHSIRHATQLALKCAYPLLLKIYHLGPNNSPGSTPKTPTLRPLGAPMPKSNEKNPPPKTTASWTLNESSTDRKNGNRKLYFKVVIRNRGHIRNVLVEVLCADLSKPSCEPIKDFSAGFPDLPEK